jgi:hypothetical protein
VKRRLVDLAVLSLTDSQALPVLADAVQEAGWFDARVMQVMWPWRGARTMNTRKRMSAWDRDRRKLDKLAWRRERLELERLAWLAGMPDHFATYAAKPDREWARAILAVLLFGDWPKRKFGPSAGPTGSPWPVVARSHK